MIPFSREAQPSAMQVGAESFNPEPGTAAERDGPRPGEIEAPCSEDFR